MERKFVFEVDGYYHLYNRGTDKRRIFLGVKDYQRFLSLLYLCNNKEGVHLGNYRGLSSVELFKVPVKEKLVHIGAYCLMPNHFHILAKEIQEGGISLFMKKLLTGYAMFFNKKYDRSGALFQGPFKAINVAEDRYLQYLFAYIHLNPVKIFNPAWRKCGIVDLSQAKNFLAAYNFFSYPEYCLNQKRDESVIVERESFPEYFTVGNESFQSLYDWLNTEESPRYE
jgi:putative transposase